MGLNESEVDALSPDKRDSLRHAAAAQLYRAGAHYVVDGIWDLMKIIDKIEAHLAEGERP